MTAVSPDKLAEIAALIEQSSPATAARLITMFERIKVKGADAVPAYELLQAVREGAGALPGNLARTPGFDRLFFDPFEAVFDDPGGRNKLPGSVPREGLARCWSLISTQILPELHDELAPQVRAAVLRGALGDGAHLVQQFRLALHERLEHDPAAVALLARTDEAQPIGAWLPDLLAADGALHGLDQPLMTKLGDLSPSVEGQLCSRVRALEEKRPSAAAAMMLLLMTRLRRPAQGFRVLMRASQGLTDRKLEQTEFAVLGHRLIALARRLLAQIEDAAGGNGFDPAVLATTVDALGSLICGFERENILDNHGPWHGELLAVRRTVSARLTTLCQRAVHDLETALPVDRTRVKGRGLMDCPRIGARLDQDRLARANDHVAFVAQVKLFAANAGFASVRESSALKIRRHLDVVCQGLLGLRGSADQHAAETLAWTEAATGLLHAFEGPEAATLFSRRLAA